MEKKFESKVISTFAGLDKTTYAKKTPNCIDLESSWWSKIPIQKHSEFERQEFENNPEFPQNYIKHIQELIEEGEYEFILISSSIYVQEELIKNNIFYYLIYPTLDKKEEYINRYKKRGSNEKFINCITRNWDERLKHHMETKTGCINIQTTANYLEDVLSWFIPFIDTDEYKQEFILN